MAEQKAFDKSGIVDCDDAVLIARCTSGDQRAFQSLYEKHIGRVYAICVRLCNDKDEASDIAQDVFIQVWKKLKDYRGDSAFSTWLYRVATNITISHLRKRKPFWARHIDWSDASSEEEMRVDSGHFEHNLDKDIAGLPEQARLVFVLFAIEGYRHEEIAKMMKIAVGTSKAQYHRARKILREKLTNE